MSASSQSQPTLLEHLRSAPFELILSSGFFGFFAHAGVVQALEDAGLVPSLVGGSSAGALVSSLWAAGMSAQQIRERLFSLRRDDFWDLDLRFGIGADRHGLGLLRGHAFHRLLDDAFSERGVRSFADCRIPLRVVAYQMATKKAVVLSRGELAPAVRASCTLPGLFQPVSIEGERYLDGGITDRAGISAATQGSRVLFHHLDPKSPWRRIWRSQNEPPAWSDLHLLWAKETPRLGPFSLHLGVRAYEVARDAAERALRGPAASSRYVRGEAAKS